MPFVLSGIEFLGCFPNPVRRMILSGLAIRKHSFRLMHCIYFFSAKKSFTWSLAMMALFEDVCTGFVGFHHFDTFGELFARTGFQRCDYFLCHIALKLFDFTMNGHLLQERVVFLALQTVGGVFLVLGRDVAGHSRNTASFLFRAFENHLYSVTFSLPFVT